MRILQQTQERGKRSKRDDFLEWLLVDIYIGGYGAAFDTICIDGRRLGRSGTVHLWFGWDTSIKIKRSLDMYEKQLSFDRHSARV